MIDGPDKIEHSYTFIERREWVNRRSWPLKTIGHRGLSSIFRSLAIRSRLPLGTFVGNVTVSLHLDIGDTCGVRHRRRRTVKRRHEGELPDGRPRGVGADRHVAVGR